MATISEIVVLYCHGNTTLITNEQMMSGQMLFQACPSSKSLFPCGQIQGCFCSIIKLTLNNVFLTATKQLYKCYSPSVCQSVRLSHFWLCSNHHIIMKFSGVITNNQSKVHAKGQGQRSKVKVTEVITQLNHCFSRSYIKLQGHTAKKIIDIDPNWPFPDCNPSLNSPMATKWCIKLELA